MELGINPIEETRRNRERLLEMHGGIDGLHRYMESEQERWEREGWRFVTIEEVLAKKRQDSGLSAAAE